MNIPRHAENLAKHFEGFYAKPYLCPAGFWTIGYGHLCSKDHSPITKDKAIEYLQQDLQVAYLQTIKLCPILLAVDEFWLGAIVDFVFNLGIARLKSSTLKKRINAGEWDDVPDQLRRWVYGGGRKLQGLVLRRQAEAAYFS
jgi:lysozyme